MTLTERRGPSHHFWLGVPVKQSGFNQPLHSAVVGKVLVLCFSQITFRLTVGKLNLS